MPCAVVVRRCGHGASVSQGARYAPRVLPGQLAGHRKVEARRTSLMSFSTRSPLRVGGANFNSGAPSTGEVNVTRGGQFTAVIWSGALNPSLVGCQTGAIASGNNVQLVSGMGRLNTIMPHSFLTSGQPVYFYDAAAITVSGVSVSGQRIIGIIPNTMRAPLVALSGNPVTTIAWEDRM